MLRACEEVTDDSIKVFDKFVDETPVCVMLRGSLEYALSEEFVNQIFETTAVRQYTRDLLFSDVVDVMSGVVCQVFPSVNAAYQKQRDRFQVSRRALYNKINLIEPARNAAVGRGNRETIAAGRTINAEKAWSPGTVAWFSCTDSRRQSLGRDRSSDQRVA